MSSVTFKDFTPELEKKISGAVKKSLHTAALIVEADAVYDCPYITGNLKNSITHEVKDDNARVMTNVEYAEWVEYGTYKQKPQPFMRPALDKNRKKINAIFEKELAALV